VCEVLGVKTNIHHNTKKPSGQSAEETASLTAEDEPLVNEETIGARYGVTGRFILQLAAKKKLPCLRLRRKCVRFDPVAVAKSFGDPNFGLHDENSTQKL